MHTSNNIITTILVMFLSIILPVTAMAESGKGRAGSWDFYLPLTYAEDATVSGNGGSQVNINEDLGFGFGFGYNYNERFQLGGLITWNSRSYDATVVRDDSSTARYSNFLETSTFSMNGTYYFRDGDISPFISGSLGYTFIDTNIQNGPPSGSCWWDPWWGYICTPYVPTRTDNAMSYGAALGVRFDINRSYSMQLGYNKSWVDIDNTSETPQFDSWRLDFIFRN